MFWRPAPRFAVCCALVLLGTRPVSASVRLPPKSIESGSSSTGPHLASSALMSTATAVTFVSVTTKREVATTVDVATTAEVATTADVATTAEVAKTVDVATTRPRRAGRLRVDADPKGATVVVRASEGPARTLTTPGEIDLPGGRVDLSWTAPGRQRRDETLTIDGPLVVKRWLDRDGQLLRTRFHAATGSNPKQVAFSPDGAELWVPLLGARGVEVFRTSTGERLGVVRLGERGGAVEAIFSSDGRTVYVSQMETASVYEIDRESKRVKRRLGTGGNWTKVLALSPDEKTLYAANWVSNDISEIDLSSGRVRRKIPTVATPRGIVVTPDGKRIYVAGFDGGELARVDLSTGRSEVLMRTGGAMRHLVISDDGAHMYADDMGSDRSFVMDLATEKITILANTDSHPNSIDVTPDGAVLFVSNRGQNGPSYYNPGPEWGSVLAIDTTDGRVLDAVVAGNQTTGLDVSPDGRLLAYTDFLDNRLVVMEIPASTDLRAGTGGRGPVYRPELTK